MKNYASRIFAALLAGAVLAGCASPNYPFPASSSSYPYPASPAPAPYPYPAQTTYPAQTATQPGYGYQFGVIDSIQAVQGTAQNNGIGVGTVVGGVVGGLLGNQVGGGSGRKAATVAGVIGGAMVGNQMERNTQAHNAYQVGVRLDNGSYRTVLQDSVGDLYVGSRVRIENDRIYRQ
jgi:outer membrane lipoprotein SlyB